MNFKWRSASRKLEKEEKRFASILTRCNSWRPQLKSRPYCAKICIDTLTDYTCPQALDSRDKARKEEGRKRESK